MDEDFQYAINGDWDALLTAMRASRAVAQRTDASGMTVLHWVCLHQDAPTDIVVKVVFANPYAVHMRNNAGHLPVDLAVQAECGQRTLEVLRAAYNGSRREDSEGAMHEQDLMASHELRGKDLDAEPATETVDYQLSYEDHTILHDGRARGPSSDYQPHQPQRYYYEDEDEEDGVDDDELEYQQHHRHYQQQPFHSQPQHARQQPPQGPPQIQRSVSNREHERMYYDNSPVYHGDLYGGYGAGGLPRNEQRLKSMALTEQRLRERENDLISVATAEDNAPLVFDPSKPPDLALMQSFQVPEDPKDEHGNGVVPRTARSKATFPPRWKQARTCHVCATGFSLVKRRHHCRNCGQSVCGQHSTNRVALPKFDLTEPQRICDGCFLSGHHMTGTQRQAPSVAGSFHSLPAQLHHPQQDSPLRRPQQQHLSRSPFESSSPFQMQRPPYQQQYQQQPYMHAR